MPITKLRPSFSFTQDRLEKLKAIVPEAFADGKINWDSLKQALGEFLEDESPEAEHGSTELAEVFGLFWPGKREARRLATLPSKGTLVPAAGEGVDEDKTRNIFIEGENLEVLKLLQKSYAGRIKMIYIDPPYNTGNDFVYKDDFKEPLEKYLKRTGQAEDDGKLLTTNTKAGGRFHSNWLNMMYPRVRLARNLLREDGIFFASIDDNEVDNLRKLCDEVFGEENRIAIICNKARASVSNDKIISSNHNFILLYARNLQPIFENRNLFGLEPDLSGFNMKDDRGKYRYSPVDGPGGAAKGNPYYTFLGVTGYFRFSEERMKRMYSDGLIVKVGNGLQQKYYLDDAKKSRRTDTTWWDDKYYTSSASSRLKELLGADVFDNPKPVELVKRMLLLWVRNNEDIVLDFFAGSCSMAHAVMDLNREDGGNRRFIMVQLPEPTPEDSPACKAGYATIAEIGKERIRRVIAKMKKESSGKPSSKRETPEDLGFKVFKLARSNFKAWQDYAGESIQELETLFDQAETPLVEGWKEQDLLTEIMLQQGFPLDSKIARQSGFKSNKVQLIESDPAEAGHSLFVCLDPKIKEDTIKHLELRTEDIFVCLDTALTDQAKMRLADICRLNII